MAPRPLTIVGLGDSTTAGTPGFRSPLEAPPRGDGNPESQYAHWMMRSHPEWTVLNRGINGETSEQIRNRIPRDVLQVRPAYAIILAGVNDIFGDQRPETIERHLAAMYAYESALFLLGPLGRAPFSRRVVRGLRLPHSSLSRRSCRPWRVVRDVRDRDPEVVAVRPQRMDRTEGPKPLRAS